MLQIWLRLYYTVTCDSNIAEGRFKNSFLLKLFLYVDCFLFTNLHIYRYIFLENVSAIGGEGVKIGLVFFCKILISCCG